MKKILFILLFLAISILAKSQTVIVIDKTNLQPLPYIAIYSNNPKVSVITNHNGKANIDAFKGADSIYFKHISYNSKVYNYNDLLKMNFKISLSEKTYSIDEVVISASKFEEKRKDVVQPIQVIKPKELAFMNQPTTADVLQNTGNVLMQKSQLGGGSPIIRGFETNKVLIVIDGVRMNNAIYRGGHTQNIITLDNSIMDKIEIVFGPGSVVYGSDALGGVMHFYTKNPLLSDTSKMLVKANAYTRYSTACNEKTGHVDFNLGWKKFASLTSFTYSDFGDLRQGANRNPLYGDWGKRTFY
ncbi:MAG: TonB-dependent receptor, partial [Bacteroidetes bacterium CG_4_10_14_3_um_filter_31_20]